MTKVSVTPVVELSEPDPLPAIRHAYRMRDEYQRAELRLNNQLKALVRRMDHQAPVTHEALVHPPNWDSIEPIIGHLKKHRDALAKERRRWERNLTALAKLLPVWAWAEDIRGIGAVSLGQVIAETGDLGTYANPAKVWKRMGLAVFEGRSQRKVKDKALAEQMGYNPRRRKVMYVIADCLVKHNRDGAYRHLYLERKAYEATLHPELTKGHIDARARRYMAKRFLRDLWAEWRATDTVPSLKALPALPIEAVA